MRRFLFRFGFVYFVLYLFPFPIYYIPQLEFVSSWWGGMWKWVVAQAATHVLHLQLEPAGSGDATWNWVRLACLLAISLAGAAVWMIFDRRDHPRLREALRIYVRFALAEAMIAYGAVKLIPSQFPPPGLERLVQTYGSSSPMGLLWTFMGASPAYIIFTGAMEMLGGLLLTVRRTTLLGALISAGVLTNVVALNVFYDVPVKLYSSHLLVMAIVLVAPDVRRLIDFFLLRRAVEPAPDEPLLRGRPATIAIVVRTAAVLAFLAYSFHDAWNQHRPVGIYAPSPLRGIWSVDHLEIDGRPSPPLITDATRWRRVVFDHSLAVSILLMNDERLRFHVTLDATKIRLVNRYDKKQKIELAYVRPGPDTLVLDGIVDGKRIHAVCRREPDQSFLLLSRGFHWINEVPYNR